MLRLGGMLGDSYDGFTQWAATASAHPALRAIVPRVTTPDFAAELSLGEIFRFAWVALWLGNAYMDEALYDLDLDWSIRPLRDVLPSAFRGRGLPVLDRWATGAVENAAAAAPRWQVPAFHIGGWWDLFRRGQVRTWQQAHPANPSKHFLMMDMRDHNWSSLTPAEGPPPVIGSAMGLSPEFLDELLTPLGPFLDRFVRGTAAPLPSTVRWRPAWGEWSASTAWPPPEARPVELYLSLAEESEGQSHLADLPEVKSGTVRWLHDPHDPIPSLADSYATLSAPPDDRLLDGRGDVVRFVAQVGPEPLQMAGPVDLIAAVGSSAESLHLMAKLIDLDPDGHAVRICDGAASPTVVGPPRCAWTWGTLDTSSVRGTRSDLMCLPPRSPSMSCTQVPKLPPGTPRSFASISRR